MEHKKIAIIGAGSVGTTTAYALMLTNTPAHVLLVDIDEMRCHGEIIDLSDAQSFGKYTTVTSGTMADAAKADIIVIAAGARQKPGQKRSELLEPNKNVVASLAQALTPLNPNAIIIMVTNPLDQLTLHAQNLFKLPRNRIFGSGTFLDTQRLRQLLSDKLSIGEPSIHAYVLGEHGDTQFAAWSIARVGGAPLSNFKQLTPDECTRMEQQAKHRAYEIIECKGSTYFGIGSCVAALCNTIISDSKRVVPVSTYLEQWNVCLSVPVILGKDGVEQILPITLSDEEQKRFATSVDSVR